MTINTPSQLCKPLLAQLSKAIKNNKNGLYDHIKKLTVTLDDNHRNKILITTTPNDEQYSVTLNFTPNNTTASSPKAAMAKEAEQTSLGYLQFETQNCPILGTVRVSKFPVTINESNQIEADWISLRYNILTKLSEQIQEADADKKSKARLNHGQSLLPR